MQMSRTYFGTPECGVLVKDKYPHQLRGLRRIDYMQPFTSDSGVKEEDYKLWVCASMNTNAGKMNELIDAINPQYVGRVAGSGNKIVYMLD